MPSVFFPFPVPLTGRQYFYIFIVQGLVAAVIDAGANFGIAYAMYHSQTTVRMWVFSENTIAGDLGVTPLIQTAVSMIISSALIHSDLHHHAIRPLPFVWLHVEHLPDPRRFWGLFGRKTAIEGGEGTKEGSGTSSPSAEKPHTDEQLAYGTSYYPLMLLRFIFEGTENNMLLDWHGIRTFIQRLILTGIQGLGLGVVFGFPLWCLAVVILGPIYGTGTMGNRWAPQVIKLVYGFLTGLITNPVIALLALGSQAEHHLVYVDEEADLEARPDGTAVNEEELTGDLGVINEHQADPVLGGKRNGGLSSPRSAPPTAFRIRSESTTSSPSSVGRRDRGRVRRLSSTSLTADVSALRPVPSLASTRLAGPASPGAGFTASGFALPNLGSPIAGPVTSLPLGHSPTIAETPTRRPRAMTASSGTGSFYLGGTGGRAQRPNRSRALTLSNTGGPKVENGEHADSESGVREILTEQEVHRASVRARSATTSNSTPLRGMTGKDEKWDVPERENPSGEPPRTPTREGSCRGMARMLTESSESMR